MISRPGHRRWRIRQAGRQVDRQTDTLLFLPRMDAAKVTSLFLTLFVFSRQKGSSGPSGLPGGASRDSQPREVLGRSFSILLFGGIGDWGPS